MPVHGPPRRLRLQLPDQYALTGGSIARVLQRTVDPLDELPKGSFV